MSIAANLTELKKELDSYNAKHIAVSKTKSNEDIMEAYDDGQR